PSSRPGPDPRLRFPAPPGGSLLRRVPSTTTRRWAMPVEPVPTPSAPASAGPYSPAVRAGDWLALAGQVGIDPATGSLAEGGVGAQTRQALANVVAVLGDCGATL